LVVFELSAFEDGRLLLDFLLDGVGEVVVDVIGVVEIRFQCFLVEMITRLLLIVEVVVIVLGGALLDEHLGAEFFEELVGLVEEFFDFVVLFEFDQFEVGDHVLLLEGLQSFEVLLVLDHLLLLLLEVVVGLGLVGDLLAVLLFLAVPLEELFLVDAQMLHEFFVLDLLSALVVALDLVLQLLYPVSLIPIFLQFLPAEVVAVEQLLLE